MVAKKREGKAEAMEAAVPADGTMEQGQTETAPLETATEAYKVPEETQEEPEDRTKAEKHSGEGTVAEDALTASEPEHKPGKSYIILCPKPVNKEIGGVLFVRGFGRTSDSFTASWFKNKGYTVEVAE